MLNICIEHAIYKKLLHFVTIFLLSEKSLVEITEKYTQGKWGLLFTR